MLSEGTDAGIPREKFFCRIADWRQRRGGRCILRGRVLSSDLQRGELILRDESGQVALQFAGAPAGFPGAGDIVAVEADPESARVRRLWVLVKSSGTTGRQGKPWAAAWRDPLGFRRLRFRSDVLQLVRRFFLERGFVELDVPALQRSTGMEPHLEPFFTELRLTGTPPERLILHTSPELALKKMLVAGFERVFYLGHVFRNGELSALHQPEFTMLEWYRAYEDYHALMHDAEELVSFLWRELSPHWKDLLRKDLLLQKPWKRVQLQELVQEKAGVDLRLVHPDRPEGLRRRAMELGFREVTPDWPADDIFFLIFLNLIEPELGTEAPTILYDYPSWIPSLARKCPEDPAFVERFEIYIDRIELANAFTELNDPVEQERRFLSDQQKRLELGRSPLPIDEDFLEALRFGMPPAAGIALGVDRLIAVLTGTQRIDWWMPLPLPIPK